jgi:hypothetical protein
MITSVEIEYDEFIYSDAEIDEIRNIWTEDAPTRTRKAYIERGGEDAQCWFNITFIAQQLTSAAIGYFLGKTLDKINITRPKKIPTCLKLSFDDVEVQINLPETIESNVLQDLLDRIQRQVDKGAFKIYKCVKIICPVKYDENDDYWYEAFEDKLTMSNLRLWGIAFPKSQEILYIYDSELEKVFEGKIK